jgi:hypothetical protein
MRIHSKWWSLVGAFLLVGLWAGLTGFHFGSRSSITPAAAAQALAPPPPVTTPRQSYADIVQTGAAYSFSRKSTWMAS